MSLAGAPAMILLSGAFFVTTDPVRITVFRLIVTPGIIATFSPIHTLFVITTASLE